MTTLFPGRIDLLSGSSHLSHRSDARRRKGLPFGLEVTDDVLDDVVEVGASSDLDDFLDCVLWNSLQGIFAPILEDESNGLGQTFPALLDGAPLAVRARD